MKTCPRFTDTPAPRSWQSVQRNFGEFGLGRSLLSLQVRCYEPSSGLCVVRTERDTVREVWAALTLLTAINGVEAALTVMHNAGSARTCRANSLKILQSLLAERAAADPAQANHAAIVAAFEQHLDAFDT